MSDDRVAKFLNYFYFFSKCGVRLQDMRVMILRFNHGMSFREIAGLEGCSYESVRLKVKKSIKRVKMSKYLTLFIP